MDPQTALELVKHGATLLLLDVPQYTLIGIDTQALLWCSFNSLIVFIFVLNFFGKLMRSSLPLRLELLEYVLQMFSSGPNFKGIKMIPPGVHFVYYSASNRWFCTCPSSFKQFSFFHFFDWPEGWSWCSFPSLQKLIFFSPVCREGNQFSPIIGFFVDAQPSQVSR